MAVFCVPAKTEDLDRVLSPIDGALAVCACPPETQIQIDLAVEEIFVNIARYAYGSEGGDAVVSYELMEDPLRMRIRFQDEGVPYNPLLKEDPDISLSAEKRPVGGLGIFLVKKLMDQMEYRRENGRNILTVTKKIQP
ncbi:MAG: ATP-binding protein [Clostridiales Family XIII bacterium]|nr:ATP-binding protein [Clostridiales Family XIII bacterium]